MLKQNKWKLLATSLITLLPALIGVFLWPRLPEQMVTRFGVDGTAEGWSSKAFAVFGLPLILLAAHLFCILVTSVDPKIENIGRKPLNLIFWIIPVVSLVVNAALYAYTLEITIRISTICSVLIGVLQIVLGNILPKIQQNYSFGLKLPWTLDDPENWNRTHRLAGWCMVLSGVVLTASALWSNSWVILGVVVLSAIVPSFYSFAYYLRHKPIEKQ